MSLHVIRSGRLSPPVGPFSQAIRSGDLIFLSGQVGLDPATGALAEGLEQQAEQIFSNLSAVLEAAGKTFGDVLRVGVFLVDMGDFAALNTVYARHFQQPYPARTTIAASALPLGALVEIDMVARA
jgi:2-iminobutanoate/2-iminopropanoate deaminase